MQYPFQVGDVVRVIDSGYYCGHYLREGAIVTVVQLEVYGEKIIINVQGDENSFVRHELGWSRKPYGDYCQSIGEKQIELVSRYVPALKKHIDPQIPII